MQSARERSQINRVLQSHGLGRIEDGTGLLAQLGFLIQNHDHFRQLLIRCEPEHRNAMYESLKPYLRFEAKAFDEYIAEAKRLAEETQLPTVDPETGMLREYKVADIRTAETAIAAVMAKGHLELTCRKCTRVEVFGGQHKAEAIQKAREAGWTYNELKGDGREICPKCPA